MQNGYRFESADARVEKVIYTVEYASAHVLDQIGAVEEGSYERLATSDLAN
jgi:hypothetical protein